MVVMIMFEVVGIKVLLFYMVLRSYMVRVVGIVYLVVVACEARLGLSVMVGVVRRNYINYVMSYKIFNL
jgi:NADH:ubiquinone oxidoreductase subunit K